MHRFWDYLFNPTGDSLPLIKFLKREGIRGCWSYWTGTLNEEAADFTMRLNKKAGWYYNEMHDCPSKGRLLQLQEEIGLKPYQDYCLHCDYYRASIQETGLRSVKYFIGTGKAACATLIYDPKVFQGQVIVDENTMIQSKHATDNEYFHPDFHSSMNIGIEYLGSKYGEEHVRAYLTQYVEHVYCR